jgi:hypothetical protein
MNDEQSKRLSDAADAVILASSAVDDMHDTLTEPRFDSTVERERLSAAQQMANKLDGTGKRIEDAIRKGTIAAAAMASPGAYDRYREATNAVREGRALARAVAEQDGTANKRAKGQEALTRLEAALASAAAIVFSE